MVRIEVITLLRGTMIANHGAYINEVPQLDTVAIGKAVEYAVHELRSKRGDSAKDERYSFLVKFS
jgi:hypothetical protein